MPEQENIKVAQADYEGFYARELDTFSLVVRPHLGGESHEHIRSPQR